MVTPVQPWSLIGACGAVPVVAPKRTGSGPGIVTIISLWQLGSNKNSSLPLAKRFIYERDLDKQSTREI